MYINKLQHCLQVPIFGLRINVHHGFNPPHAMMECGGLNPVNNFNQVALQQLNKEMKSFMNHYENFKMAHPTTPHPLSHTLCLHLAQPLPLPICMSLNLASACPTLEGASSRLHQSN